MADIQTDRRKKGADAIYVRQRYKADDGSIKQKRFRCIDMAEARDLQPLIEAAEREGRLYVDTRPVTYQNDSNSALSRHYGAVSNRYADITIAELIPMYLQDAATRKRFSPNTLAAKRGIVSNHIIPYIGSVHIREIDTMFIQDFFDDLLTREGAPGNHKTPPTLNSARTVFEVRKILSPAFAYAITRLRAIKNNPITRDIIMPKVKTKKREQWDYDELIKALSAESDPQLKALIAVMFVGTLRNCELLGLCWDCVHIPAKITEENPAFIDIKHELLPSNLADNEATGITPIVVFPKVQGNPKSRMCLFEKTKTERTRRKVYLPEEVVEILMEHRRSQNLIKDYYGDTYQDYNLVFALEERFPGRPISNNTINRYFRKFKEHHELRDVTFYSLRGASVTQKLDMPGTDLEVMSIDMGGDGLPVMAGHYVKIAEKKRIKIAFNTGKKFWPNSKDETIQENQDNTD